jgi:hypothetical protein
MDESSYGLIVEGFYDEGVYGEFVRKVVPLVEVFFRRCGGVAQLMKRFPVLLRDLEHFRQGRPVDKALVIRDWRGPDVDSCEQRLMQKVEGKNFAFPRGVQFCGVRQEMEAWLLADVNAINSVARDRGGRTVSPVQGEIEEIGNPKERLTQLLSEARLPYDAEVCREIAQRADIETLRRRCPSFRSFERKVLDC